MKEIIGKLIPVDLREIWMTEDRDFTPWLAQEDNLQVLADTIGLELELEAQEKEVGPFRADILCKNVNDDSWVLIENQIEKTDHKHLGQLLTYAAGLKAVTIVWVARKFSDEHRAALDWLNEITDDNFKFFGLEVELWKINESPVAPRFNVISQPNNWSKTVSRAAQKISDEGNTDTQELQLRYWTKLIEYLDAQGSHLRPQNPRPRHWQIFTIGRSGVHVSAIQNKREKRLGVELCMTHPDKAKAFFHLLAQDKDAIEREIGSSLEWRENPEKTQAKIILFKKADPTIEENWPEQHAWLLKTVEGFDRTFRQRVRNLNPDEWKEA